MIFFGGKNVTTATALLFLIEIQSKLQLKNSHEFVSTLNSWVIGREFH